MKIVQKLKCKLGFHIWRYYQHSVKTDDRDRNSNPYCFVIAFKICNHCAKSKLIHLLE